MALNRFSRVNRIVTGPKAGAGEELPLLECELTRLEHFAHFWVLVVQSFIRNRCFVRASALSFSTLLALIPMLAVAICVTSSLLKSEGEDQIYAVINKFVDTVVPPATVNSSNLNASTNSATASLAVVSLQVAAAMDTNPPAAGSTNVDLGTNAAAPVTAGRDDPRMISAQKEAAKTIHEFVQKTRSSPLGVVGMLLLIYVAISMLANVEATFNDIWGVALCRSWRWRIVVYWATLTLGPLALVGAASLAGGAHVEMARQLASRTPFLDGLIFKVLPVVIIWLVFALIYLTVPNTKVRLSAALVGGVLAGSLWHVNNLLGYLYVSRFVTNNMIYGSLGLLPVFMAGLYISWVILLFGVQVSYAFQNRKDYIQDKFAENVNQRGREFIALRLMTCLGLRYQNGQAPATTEQIAVELGISNRLTDKIIDTLLSARLISEVAGPDSAYFPARPLDAINAHQVLLALRSVSKPVVHTREEPVRDEIYGEFARIEEAERAAAASVTMLALVNRARAKLEPVALIPAGKAPVLPETTLPEVTPQPVEAVEVTADLPAPSFAGAVRSAEPVKAARKIAVPDDNHDFPL